MNRCQLAYRTEASSGTVRGDARALETGSRIIERFVYVPSSLFSVAIAVAVAACLPTTAFGQSRSRGNVTINRGFSSNVTRVRKEMLRVF